MSEACREVKISGITIGPKGPLALIAGPCVVESRETTFKIAEVLRDITDRLGLPFVFKASFDKANKTIPGSYRGPGMDAALKILADVKKEFGVPVISDIHEVWQAGPASEVLDVIQIPTQLQKQIDLVMAAANTGKPVALKRGHFTNPKETINVVRRIAEVGNHNILIIERGNTVHFGHVIVDFRSFVVLREHGYPVVFDGSHSAMMPDALAADYGGCRRFIPSIALSAVASGVDALFLEVHVEPGKAMSDSGTTLAVGELEPLLRRAKGIREVLKG